MKSHLSITSFMNSAYGVYLKSHRHTKGHLGFLLCCLLGVLWFCILCLGLWSILSWFLWRVQDLCLDSILFFFVIWMSTCSSTICWKDYLCSVVLPLLLCQRLVDYLQGPLCFILIFYYRNSQTHTKTNSPVAVTQLQQLSSLVSLVLSSFFFLPPHTV